MRRFARAAAASSRVAATGHGPRAERSSAAVDGGSTPTRRRRPRAHLEVASALGGSGHGGRSRGLRPEAPGGAADSCTAAVAAAAMLSGE